MDECAVKYGSLVLLNSNTLLSPAHDMIPNVNRNGLQLSTECFVDMSRRNGNTKDETFMLHCCVIVLTL